MKVFCFVQLFHISERGGGAEVQANYLSEELASRGYKVHYICQTVNESKTYSSTSINGVNIHWIPIKRANSLQNFKNIKNLLLKINADYIIERMTSSYGWPIIKAKKSIKAKYIWICTDNESPVLFRTVKNYFRKKSFVKFLFAFTRALKIDLIRIYANKKADIIFTQNDIQKKRLKKNFNLDSFRMISGHSVPKDNLPTSQRFKNKTVLWCANFGAHKRPELFIELASKMKNSNFKFVMVGGHSDKVYVNKLLKCKPSNLYTTGQLPFKQALEYFDTSTVLINTSISEGFSNTYIQAWLRKVPTMVFGADPDAVIKKNKLGYNVSSLDDGIDKLKLLMSDYEAYKALSDNACVYGFSNHSIKIMTDNFIKTVDATI